MSTRPSATHPYVRVGRRPAAVPPARRLRVGRQAAPPSTPPSTPPPLASSSSGLLVEAVVQACGGVSGTETAHRLITAASKRIDGRGLVLIEDSSPSPSPAPPAPREDAVDTMVSTKTVQLHRQLTEAAPNTAMHIALDEALALLECSGLAQYRNSMSMASADVRDRLGMASSDVSRAHLLSMMRAPFSGEMPCTSGSACVGVHIASITMPPEVAANFVMRAYEPPLCINKIAVSQRLFEAMRGMREREGAKGPHEMSGVTYGIAHAREAERIHLAPSSRTRGLCVLCYRNAVALSHIKATCDTREAARDDADEEGRDNDGNVTMHDAVSPGGGDDGVITGGDEIARTARLRRRLVPVINSFTVRVDTPGQYSQRVCIPTSGALASGLIPNFPRYAIGDYVAIYTNTTNPHTNEMVRHATIVERDYMGCFG